MMIHLEGDGVWKDLHGTPMRTDNIAAVCALKGGMASGAPSVAIRIDLEDGTTVIGQTSMRLFLAAADAFRARYGGGAGPLDAAKPKAAEAAKPTTPAPAVGQRWADNDKRSPAGREVVIRQVDGKRALCEVFEGGVWTGRSTLIALRRFRPTSTGYRFVGVEAAR